MKEGCSEEQKSGGQDGRKNSVTKLLKNLLTTLIFKKLTKNAMLRLYSNFAIDFNIYFTKLM